MSLFPDQQKAADDFLDWLINTPEETMCGLWASAGFGKSHSVKHMINEVVLKHTNYVAVLTSMTHSAVSVLSDFTGMDVTTLHSLMGWIPHIDKETGEESVSTPRMRDKNADDRLTPNMLLIIDEAGLCGHTEIRLLKEECERTGARVMFVGDNKQCFPVLKPDEELCVPAYDNSETIFELTTPKRTSDDDMIYALALKYREAVDGARQPRLKTLLNKDGKTGVRYVDDLEEMAVHAFKAGVRDGNTRNIKILAFTNSRCLTLNRKIRKKVLGLKGVPIVGEEMVANTAIQNATNDAVLIRNNQMVIVKEAEATESYGLSGAFIQFEYEENGEMVEVKETIFVPESPAKLAKRLKTISNDAKAFAANGFHDESKAAWRQFFSLKEGVADIRYTYAMTINKAQGITLKHALIDLDDINIAQGREAKARMAYTAVTRATTYVTIEGVLDER